MGVSSEYYLITGYRFRNTETIYEAVDPDETGCAEELKEAGFTVLFDGMGGQYLYIGRVVELGDFYNLDELSAELSADEHHKLVQIMDNYCDFAEVALEATVGGFIQNHYH